MLFFSEVLATSIPVLGIVTAAWSSFGGSQRFRRSYSQGSQWGFYAVLTKKRDGEQAVLFTRIPVGFLCSAD